MRWQQSSWCAVSVARAVVCGRLATGLSMMAWTPASGELTAPVVSLDVKAEEASTESADDTGIRLRLGGPPSVEFPDPLATRSRSPALQADPLVAVHEDIQAQNWSEAIRVLRPMLQENPENRAAHMAAVFVLERMGRHREAIGLLEGMIKRWPDDFRVINNLAWMHATVRPPEERNALRAMDLARDAVLRTPNDYRVWSTLAECYYVTGDFDRAERTIRKAIEIAARVRAGEEEMMVYREQLFRFRQARAAFQLQR